jgi:prefoldin subunit 5
MRSWIRPTRILGFVLLLTSAAGCTISIQPWTKPVPPTQEPPLAATHNPSGFKAPMPATYPTGPYPPGAYPGPYPNNGAGNESVSQLIKQFNEAEDQRKALQEQVHVFKKLSKERDDSLQQASYEMEESSKQLKRTREEFRQFGAEIDELRDRVKKLEEMRTALRPLIDEIMYHLEREKEAAKLPRVSTAPK